MKDGEALIERSIPLARSVAARYAATGEPLEDLVQVACIGLVEAAERFDPGRGVAFSSFAVPTIVGEIKRHLRDNSWSVHVPRGLQELSLRVERISDDLVAELGRSPSTCEVAQRGGLTPEQVLEGLRVKQARRAVSLEALVVVDEDEHIERLGIDDPGFARVDEIDAGRRPLRTLPARERLVVVLRFRCEHVQARIASELGLSQMHISRLLRRALARLADTARTPP